MHWEQWHDPSLRQIGRTNSCIQPCTRYLLSEKANPNIRAKDGSSPLTQTLGDNGAVQSAKLLLDAGADVNAKHLGLTPLSMAAMLGRTEWVAFCI